MNGSIGEAIVRAAAAEYAGPAAPFVKTRALAWLGGLEFDCYSAALGIAFEYQGIQHYELVPHFHRGGADDLERQRARDRRKRELAADNGVALVEVPYTIPAARLRAHVHRELYLLGIDPAGPFIADDAFLDHVRETDSLAHAMLAKAQAIAASYGAVCLSAGYVDCHTPLRFHCRYGHDFEAELAAINAIDHARPRFCRVCGGTAKRGFDATAAEVAVAGFTLLDMRTVRKGAAKAKPITELQIRCPAGHEKWTERNNFLPLKGGRPRRGCRRCSGVPGNGY